MTNKNKSAPLKGLLLLMFVLACVQAYAGGEPYQYADPMEVTGTWRQVASKVIDRSLHKDDSWFKAKQFFRFTKDGGLNHVITNPDPKLYAEAPDLPRESTRRLLQQTPIQTLTWKNRGVAVLKHPERPEQRVDFLLFSQNLDELFHDSSIKVRKGDLLLGFFHPYDYQKIVYYRLLRKLEY